MAVSELLAVGSAACTAGSIMLLGKASGRLGVYRSARLQLTSAFVMTAMIAVLVTGWTTPAPWQIGYLIASGFFGMVVGNLAYNATIQSIGPRLTALLFSLTSPFSLVLGYLVLGETITLWQLCGVATVLAGIVLAVGPVRGVAGLPLRGLGMGVLTALVQALGMLCARPVMASGVEPFVATTVRAGFAAAVFLGMTPFMWRHGAGVKLGLAPLAQVTASSFLGIVVGMSLMMAALATGHVGLVTTLAATVPVVILPMIWAVTGTAPTPQAWAGAILSAIGTAVISLAG